MLGYQVEGHGGERIIFLHDWFSDQSSYDYVKPYLPWDQMTGAFLDLRGYGCSKAMQGTCELAEIVQDVLDVADHLKWPEFHLVTHSMTGIVAQYMAAQVPGRVKRVMAVTPVPAAGTPVPDDLMEFLEDAARSNDQSAEMIVKMMTGERYMSGFMKEKVRHWRACSQAEARVAYLHMFTQTNLLDQVRGCQAPIRLIAGRFDAPSYQKDVLEMTIMQWFPKASLVRLECGHYPMQEIPTTFAAEIERFFIDAA